MSTKQKVALITGITGQDGPYLAQILLRKGYKVYGMVRRVSHNDFSFLYDFDLSGKIELIEGDLSDSHSIFYVLNLVKPDEVYNLAAQSHVHTSFSQPETTANITGLGTLRLLEVIRLHFPNIKFCQASSSEMFGDVKENDYEGQDESTEFRPRSVYAASKVFAHHMIKYYREAYGLYATTCIMFNHEGERRGTNFVTRKITKYVGEYVVGLDETSKPLQLGNLNACRDWSYAADMMEGMYLSMQQAAPDDYVLASGETHSVREFVELAFAAVDINIVWEGTGLNEKGIDADNGMVLVEVNEDFYRPSDVEYLLGDATKSKRLLGWTPFTPFSKLVELMVENDVKRAKQRLKANYDLTEN